MRPLKHARTRGCEPGALPWPPTGGYGASKAHPVSSTRVKGLSRCAKGSVSGYTVHNNFDVVTLLRFGWQTLPPPAQRAAATHIQVKGGLSYYYYVNGRPAVTGYRIPADCVPQRQLDWTLSGAVSWGW